MTRITCVGIAVLDLVFRVDRFPRDPGKYRASERHEVGGGVAATAAATVAALGGEAAFVGCVGDDDVGERIVADLELRGVDCMGVRRIPGAQSPLSAVLVDAAGERWVVNHASADLFDRGTLPTEADLAGSDAVLADMRWPAASALALGWARRCDRPAVLDCDHDPSAHPEVLAAASHAVFALPTLAAFVGSDDPAAALRAATRNTHGLVVATAGSRGVHWLEGGEHRHLAAFPVEVVDTLGAGDVFHGAFVLALTEGRSLADALGWASAAAALKCTRFGGRDGIPTRDEVDRLVEEREPWR